MEPCHIAQFALMLAKKLANAYGKHPIAGGQPGFVYAVNKAMETLGNAMTLLGMYKLTSV
jgi:arginyl-tRNA synthetase